MSGAPLHDKNAKAQPKTRYAQPVPLNPLNNATTTIRAFKESRRQLGGQKDRVTNVLGPTRPVEQRSSLERTAIHALTTTFQRPYLAAPHPILPPSHLSLFGNSF